MFIPVGKARIFTTAFGPLTAPAILGYRGLDRELGAVGRAVLDPGCPLAHDVLRPPRIRRDHGTGRGGCLVNVIAP